MYLFSFLEASLQYMTCSGAQWCKRKEVKHLTWLIQLWELEMQLNWIRREGSDTWRERERERRWDTKRGCVRQHVCVHV